MKVSGYRIKRTIGKGGMGTVYLATQESLERDVVLKTMSLVDAEGTEFAERFFTPDAAAIIDALKATPGATPAASPSVPTACAGPLLVDLVLPLSDASIDAACAACEDATSLWLGWMAAAEKLEFEKAAEIRDRLRSLEQWAMEATGELPA